MDSDVLIRPHASDTGLPPRFSNIDHAPLCR